MKVNKSSPEDALKQELKKLQADYQQLFDASPVAMFITDPKTAKFIAANNAAVDTYHYTKEEFLQLTPDDLSNNKNGLQATVQSSSHYTHYNKNGTALFVEMKKSDVVYKETQAQLITIINVTDKVLAEVKEQQAKQRLDAIFEGTHNAIFLADDFGKYHEVNNAATVMLGYSKSEILALSVADIVVNIISTDRDHLWNQFMNAGSQSGIIELKKKTGEIITCHYNATANVLPGLHLSIVADVTEREMALKKIDEQAKYIEAIVESITDCFFVVDNNSIIKYWNKSIARLFNIPASEAIGLSIWDVYKNSAEARFYKKYRNAMNLTMPVQFIEYYADLKIWLDVSIYPTTDGLTIYFKDITQRKKLSLEILQAKNDQAALINSTTNLIWSINTECKLVSFNNAYRKRLAAAIGFPPFEGLQLPVAFNNKLKKDRWQRYYHRALSGEVFCIDDEVIVDDITGETKLAEIRFTPIYEINCNKVKGAACHSRDITERVLNQSLIEEKNEKLRSSEAHLQKLTKKLEKVMKSSLDIICSLDTDGCFTQVSEASETVLGYTPLELTGRSVFEFIDTGFAEKTKEIKRLLAKGKSLIGVNNALVHKNGHLVPLSWSAKLDKEEGVIYAVARDATWMVEAEKIKAVTEQRFEALMQKGADLVGIVDTKGNYLYVSSNVESVLGYNPDFFHSKNTLDFIHHEDVEMAKSELEKVIDGEEAKLAAFRYKHANGDWRWFETIATNQLNNPAINGIVVNARDITKRKQIELERELMIKELLKSNADLKQFSFITSHNLRAPLSNITGILNILDLPDLNDYNRQMIEMLNASVKQLHKTIDDLSNILIIKNNVNVEISVIGLEEAVNDVKKTFLHALSDVAATMEIDFEVKAIRFNKTYFKSILVNLVSNSIKYRFAKRDLVIKMTSKVDAEGNIIFTFSDNGIGIDLQRHEKKLFGLYQRFQDHVEGHGIGLFIIKSQIVALGGTIEVESEPGKGTTFTISFKNLGEAVANQLTKNSLNQPLQLEVNYNE